VRLEFLKNWLVSEEEKWHTFASYAQVELILGNGVVPVADIIREISRGCVDW